MSLSPLHRGTDWGNSSGQDCTVTEVVWTPSGPTGLTTVGPQKAAAPATWLGPVTAKSTEQPRQRFRLLPGALALGRCSVSLLSENPSRTTNGYTSDVTRPNHGLQHMTKSQENAAPVLRKKGKKKKKTKTKQHRSSFLTAQVQNCTFHISQ